MSMCSFFKGLKTAPLDTLYDWQNGRWPWGIIAFAMIMLVLLAHYLFQNWMHMLPCEQCVYIRYGNLVMALGAIIAMINPKAVWTKICGYVLGFYGLIYTFICSWKLMAIHDAVHSDDLEAMFGMQGCSMEPKFHFGLPLDKWAPEWFKPTGDCGYDAPMPAEGVELLLCNSSLSNSIRVVMAGTLFRSGSSWIWLNAASSLAVSRRSSLSQCL